MRGDHIFGEGERGFVHILEEEEEEVVVVLVRCIERRVGVKKGMYEVDGRCCGE